MAELLSTVAVKQTAVNGGKLSTTELGGRVRIAHGSVTPASAGSAGDTVKLVRLPKGARILPVSQLHFEAGQDATLKVQVGDKDDDDRYLAASVVGASATSINIAGNALADTVLTEETDIVLKTSVAGLAAGKKVSFDIFYVVD